jgi:hypothetical protein
MTNTDRVTTVSLGGDDRLKHIGTIEDLAEVVLPQSEPPQCAPCNGACQGNPPPSFSAGFLLLNFEFPHRDTLAFSLRRCGQRVVVPQEQSKTDFDFTDDEMQNADYVFCDLTRKITHNEFQKLRRICRLRKTDGASIPKTCWVPDDWTVEFQRFIGVEFEAHIIPRKPSDPNLPQETIHSTSNSEDAPRSVREEGGTS